MAMRGSCQLPPATRIPASVLVQTVGRFDTRPSFNSVVQEVAGGAKDVMPATPASPISFHGQSHRPGRLGEARRAARPRYRFLLPDAEPRSLRRCMPARCAVFVAWSRKLLPSPEKSERGNAHATLRPH